ncbi:methyltransferase, FkbM family [Limimonas halophila]|uniref:Methyltransferase, FkbM family n=1 Tax=Limimonas halophila TaxID=1082479 RepID=A0A1G7RY07_9PROT|nr:FkbM family methyltransferase [Limimonas halophila]SDG15631.1 methyltransferase, FkbM family [Limimonas halophila]
MRRAVKLARLLTRRPWRLGLRRGVAAAVEHANALRTLDAVTVIDVGANRGQFVLAARALLPGAHVHAVEPLAAPAEVLHRVAAALGGITVHRAAVAPERGRATMQVPARTDSASLLPVGARQTRVFPGTHAVRTETVRTAPLADLVPSAVLTPPVLLKLDVQGSELDTLRASTHLLPQIDWVLCECSDVELYAGQALRPAVEAYLADHGFQPVRSDNAVTHPAFGRVQADVLFARYAVSASSPAAESAASAS